jgi:energy-coupling factor transporter ATP-binding protein EcfA2
MVNSLNIHNFRCFREASLGSLRQFNIIVGDNGSGKTSLLEAIFLLASASPGGWFKLRFWRGLSQTIKLTGTRSSYESIFRDLFHNFNSDAGTSISMVDSNSGRRSLNISYSGRRTYKLPSGGRVDNVYLIEPIVFHWRLKDRSFKTKVVVSPKDGTLQIEGEREVYPAWFSSPAIPEGQNAAYMFSEMSQQNKSGPLVSLLCSVFPQVKAVTLESVAGELVVCVQMDHLNEKLPIGSVSAGISKFFSIVVAIASNHDGVLLIDEFEEGFYYDHIPVLLEKICSFCEECNVQFFASTHSYEFLQRMLPVFKKREGTPAQFALIRATRDTDQCRLTTVGDPSAAIENDLEVR